MSKSLVALIACATLAGGMLLSVDSAEAKKKASAAAQSTDIESCAKVDASARDVCISRSRPVSGAELNRKWAAKRAAAAVKGAAAKATETVKGAAAKATEAVKGAAATAKVATMKLGSGPTKIDDCGKMAVGERDACISRSSPVMGADLYKKYKK